MQPMTLSKLGQLLGIPNRGQDVLIKRVTTDTRTLQPGDLFVALVGEHFDGHDFIAAAQEAGAAAVMVSRTVQTDLPLLHVPDTLLGLAQLARAYRQMVFQHPMVAITGSSGKTTTKEMTASILRQAGPTLATQGNFNNAIGVPLTLLNIAPEDQYAVIEMGANHAGEIAYTMKIAEPTISLITNVAPAHLKGFGSIEGVASAKSEIYENLTAVGTIIINRDDQFAKHWLKQFADRRILTFGLTNQADFYATDLQADAENHYQFNLHGPFGEVSIHLPLKGKHNVLNALAAAAAAYVAGATPAHIQAGLQAVPATKGRLVSMRGKDGIRLIDDTYNANPGSVKAAIEVLAHFSGQRILVLGDLGELGENASQYHEQIGADARSMGVNELYACGQLTSHTVKAFGSNGFHFATAEELIQALSNKLSKNATVLVKGSRSAKMERVVAALTENN